MFNKKRSTLRIRSRRRTETRPRAKRVLLASIIVLVASGLGLAAYFQSFEIDTYDWVGATRVPTLTHGVASKIGAFHAETDPDTAYTFWSGESKSFSAGYTTSIDIYLDTSAPYMNGTGYSNDTRFDWDSAIGTPQCSHRRDFVFNGGYYSDVQPMVPGNQAGFIFSASNNAGRGSSFPNNPERMPITIVDEGWFTFEHRFRDNGAGVLAVDLTIRDSLGNVRGTWTLSDPSDVIGVNVGGNQYGWFAQNEFTYLAFDTAMLAGFQDYCTIPSSTPGAKITGGGWIPWMNNKGTFGLTAKVNNDGVPSGNLTYQDHGLLERTVKSTTVTSVSVSGNCADINGNATVNGSGSFGYHVRVCDNGEPGSDSDTFSISMSDGYTASGTLGGGNIQIH